MRRFCCAVLLALALAAPPRAQVVDVVKENRVENFGEGFCSWCCIEMLGRTHGVKELHDLAKNRSKESDYAHWDGNAWVRDPFVRVPRGPNLFVKEGVGGGGEWAVHDKLKTLGVKFRMQWRYSSNKELIEYAMKNKLGCVIAIEGEGWAHAVVLVDFNDKEVKYIDPNDVSEVKTKSSKWFFSQWKGYIVVIEKP